MGLGVFNKEIKNELHQLFRDTGFFTFGTEEDNDVEAYVKSRISSENENERRSARALYDYLRQLNQRFKNFMYDTTIFEEDVKDFEPKPQLLMEFLKSSDFADNSSPMADKLSSYFNLLNGTLTLFKTLETRKIDQVNRINTQQNNADLISCREELGKLEEEFTSMGLELNDRGNIYSLSDDVLNAIGEAEKAIKEDEEISRKYLDNYGLGPEGGEEQLRIKHYTMLSDIKDMENDLEHMDNVDIKKAQAEILEGYIESDIFEEYEEKDTEYLEELQSEYDKISREADEIEKELYSEETRQKLEEYNNNKDIFITIDSETRGKIAEYIENEKFIEEITRLQNQETLNRIGQADLADRIIPSPALVDKRRETGLFIGELRVKLAEDNSKIIMQTGQRLSEYKDVIAYMENPSSKDFIDRIRDLESRNRTIQTQRQGISEKLKKEKDAVIKEKKKFASKIPFNFSGDEIARMPYSDIAQMYRDRLEEYKSEVEGIISSDKYKAAVKKIEIANEEAQKYNAKEIIPKFKAFEKKKKAHLEHLGKLKKLSEKVDALESRKREAEQKKTALEQEAAALKHNAASDSISAMLNSYDESINHLTRKGITFDDDKTPDKSQFSAANSKEFFRLRLSLRKAKEVMADSSRTAEEKAAFLSDLHDAAKEYVAVRTSETRLFEFSTRKFRIAFARDIERFASNAMNALEAENAPEERLFDAEEVRINENKEKEEKINDVPESAPEEINPFEKWKTRNDEQMREKLAGEITQRMNSLIPSETESIRLSESMLELSYPNPDKKAEKVILEKVITKADFARYLALSTTKSVLGMLKGDMLQGCMTESYISLNADTIMASESFDAAMKNLEKKDFYEIENLETFTKAIMTNVLKESAVPDRSREYYLGSIERRLNNISPMTSAAKLKLSDDEIAKFLYFGTIYHRRENLTTEQLKNFTGIETTEKQIAIIKEKDFFKSFVRGLAENPKTAQGVNRYNLNSMIRSYVSGEFDLGGELRPEDILNLTKSQPVKGPATNGPRA